MNTTDRQTLTETKLKRIAWLSGRDQEKKFDQLMHHFNEESLKECFYMLKNNKAVGIDGVTKKEYELKLDDNIKDLITRMKRMQYRPGNVREVLIAKEGKANATRPLGISNLEDKIIQKMMHRVLEAIYEPLFRKSSYGFRPGIECHDATRALRQHAYESPVEAVLDVDIENFFGSVDHKELENILRVKIKDQTLMRYIIRMSKAGILRQGELTVSEEGVMQGSMCSPIVANIFAHLRDRRMV